METTKLPHADLEVSRACMGTMTFGSQADEAESRRMVDVCLDAGINFFDTANVYNQGRSEEILGAALGPRRKQVILASKVRGLMKREPSYGGLSRVAIRRAIEETLEIMEELRREGKIRYSATSNYSAWQLCEIFWLCEKNGYLQPWASQPMYNMLARGIEQEYLTFTERFEVGVVAYNPLAGGLLTGKHSPDKGPIEGTRFDGNQMYQNRYWNEGYFRAVEELKTIAGQAGRGLVELALTWVFARDRVDSIILGASGAEQLENNLRAIESPPLDPSTLEQCDQVWGRLRGPTPIYNR